MIFYLFFLLHGFFALLAQVVILRELMITFYGNELFSGVVLGIWLLGTGMGSLLALRLRRFQSLKSLFLILLFLSLTIFLEIFLIRFYAGKAVLPGQIPPVSQSFLFVFFILFPFCFILDASFAWTANLWLERVKQRPHKIISRAYLLETIGLTIAGLVFSFFLIKTTFPLPVSLNDQTLKFRFPNLVESVNSYYGNITVTKLNQQYNFYESGSFIDSNKEIESNEYLAHLILTQHQEPRSVLLIGGGLNGLIFEILKYPSVKKVDYVELDSKLVEIQKKYLPDYLVKILESPRVKINLIDGRKFLKKTKERYDVAIFNLPNPSTALINRFYTQEAFIEVKKILSDKGVFALSLFAPVDYLSREGQGLVILINQSIKSVFPNILVLPEETEVLFLASVDKVLITNPEIIKERFEKNKIVTSFATSDYLSYRLTSGDVKLFEKMFQEARTEKINLDFHPLAYLLESAFWQTKFSFETAKIFRGLAFIDFKVILLILLIIYYWLFLKTKTRQQISFLITFLAGLTLMSFEILIIYIFQVKLGLVFSKIALIFTIILAALGLGNHWVAKRKMPVKGIFFLIILYCLFFILIIKKIALELSFYILAGTIGFLTGTIFPLANRILFAQEKEPSKQTGYLYAADLLGAFTGAVLPSIFLIPVFGVMKTIFVLGILNSFPLLKKLEP